MPQVSHFLLRPDLSDLIETRPYWSCQTAEVSGLQGRGELTPVRKAEGLVPHFSQRVP